MPRDRGTFIGQMLTRLGFTIAILLGAGFLFDLIQPGGLVVLHMLSGFLTLAGIWLTTLRLLLGGRQGAPLLGAASVLIAVGAGMGLDLIAPGPGLVHLLVMVIAVALSEIGSARAARS